jgi:DNA-binding NtrC family response regulator
MSEPGDNRNQHILFVEDHDQLRRILTTILRNSGYEVTATQNADMAIELLQQGLPADILLSDIRMAGTMDGVQLAEWVRDRHPAIGILLQTAYSSVDTKGFPVLHKPFSPDELLIALNRIAPVAAELTR